MNKAITKWGFIFLIIFTLFYYYYPITQKKVPYENQENGEKTTEIFSYSLSQINEACKKTPEKITDMNLDCDKYHFYIYLVYLIIIISIMIIFTGLIW